MRAPLVAATIALSVLPASVLAQVPRGPQFRVNAYTTDGQGYPAVAADAAGNFVVTWSSYTQDGDVYGIFARRHDPSGVPVGAAEFRVNAFTTGAQTRPAVAMAADGALVFVWEDGMQEGSQGVYGRMFDAVGTPAGGEFRAPTYTTSSQLLPAVGADAAGNFVVVWDGAQQDGSGGGVFAQRFDAGGVTQGPEFRVNSFTNGSQRYPAVAMAASGAFVVVWESTDGNGFGVFAQRYDAAGAAAGPEFRVNAYTTNGQYGPVVAADADGNFVVVWNSQQFPGADADVMARRYDATGVPTTAEFRVNTYTTAFQIRPSVASDPAGNFVVAWHGAGANDGLGVFARWHDSSATGGAEFTVNSIAAGFQTYPSAAMDGQGNFVVAWTAADADNYGVFARQFQPERIFRDDFESGNLSAWTASNTGGGDLVVSSAAALNFTSAGLLGMVDDTAALFVEDHTPDDELRYRVRFHLDPNGFDPGEAEDHRRTRVFIAFTEAPTRRVAAVVLRRLAGAYAIMGRARLDDNVQADTGFFTISDAPHVIEFDLKPASDADAEDGSFELRIDGATQTVLAGLDNSLARVDLGRLGALSVKTAANGTIYWDEFESWRTGFPAP
jgi:hypothetical protein